MNKLLVFLAALLLPLGASASVDHWTCSNDQTVMYMVLDTDEGQFMLWDDQGQLLAGAKFTEASKTSTGLPFLFAELGNGAVIGVAKDGNKLILAISNEANKAVKFICN